MDPQRTYIAGFIQKLTQHKRINDSKLLKYDSKKCLHTIMHDNVFNLAALFIIEHSEITFVHKTFFDIYQLFISRVFRLKKKLKNYTSCS